MRLMVILFIAALWFHCLDRAAGNRPPNTPPKRPALSYKEQDFLDDPAYAAYMRKEEQARRRVIDRKLAARGVR